ncbi:phage terminase large subunit family protein, partial [Escherichia coli]|nr:hypothetical protein [Escherichia coli]EHU7539386.1 phage terminase large subunit family protein [Escherichia coli]
MNISNSQVNRLRHFVRAGLRSLFRPEPQTAVEWADANYYLPKESAYQEGRWETLPFQRAIMNAMGSDYIREVNVVKSARVGYSKMLLGVYAYFIEHKQRNTLIWLPTDGDAENFMKTHVEPTIRDIPSLLALAPWYGKKHRDNTLTMKRFSNGRGFWCLGGKAAKNYREKSVDVAGYDELAAFDEDIEQEGSPTFLGDKRIEGSVWPKSIRGSTPKVRGTCQIERAASESPHFMRFHVACPHCGEEQYLKFGDKETPFGLKWTPDDPSSVFYLCEHNACVIRQQELDFTDARYICEKTGIWTRDGILWFSSSGEEIEPPDSVTFHIWTAYSPFTTWVQIVKDWMKTKGDSTGNSLAWALGSSVGVSKMLSLKNFFSGAEILLNGNDGAVQLKTGAVNGAKAQALTINKDEVNSTVDLTLTKQTGTGNRFVLQNLGNTELSFAAKVWGSSDRQNVFEVGTSAAYLFYAQKTSAGQLFDVNGAINCTTLNQSSDRDLKDDILVISDATKAIRKMNGYTYTLRENGMPYAGVIAQEVMEAIPEAVGSFTHYGEELQGPTVDGNELREETRYLNVDYAAVTGLLVQVARETDGRVTALEEENITLRKNLATAGTRISTLENQV